MSTRHDAATALEALLRTVQPDWESAAVFAENAGLLGQIVSRVALAQNGRAIRHLSAELTDDSVRVTAFFDDAVVDASFKEGALIVDLLPLRIASLRITATQDTLADARVDPEQPLAVNVTLAEGRTLTLRGSGADDDPLTLFLPRLFELTT